MPTFSRSSQQKLAECDHRLQEIFSEVVKIVDILVICGHRGRADQDKAVAEGKSGTPYPTSKHNSEPSRAIDVAQYFPDTTGHIRWDDKASFTYVAGIAKGVAHMLGHHLRWGGDWDSDNDQQDEKGLRDFPHFEVID